MRKYLILITLIGVLASCSSKRTLYTWEDYDKTSYVYLKETNEETRQNLLNSYQDIIDKQKGTRGVTPPGIYADYGFLLIQANQTKQGKKMLQKEMDMYPESSVFINRILKMIEE